MNALSLALNQSGHTHAHSCVRSDFNALLIDLFHGACVWWIGPWGLRVDPCREHAGHVGLESRESDVRRVSYITSWFFHSTMCTAWRSVWMVAKHHKHCLSFKENPLQFLSRWSHSWNLMQTSELLVNSSVILMDIRLWHIWEVFACLLFYCFIMSICSHWIAPPWLSQNQVNLSRQHY